jgi:uncharacterized protein YbcC (UPF0753/DUF2309 family)
VSVAVKEPAGVRAQIRSEAILAGRFLAPVWPIERFIAINPLGGLEHLPFGAALRRAGELLGARGTMPESWFRDKHAEGRITDRDLLGALRRGGFLGADPRQVRLGERTLGAAELLLLDLHLGKPLPAPVRRVRTIAEIAGADVAERVDSQTVKWCAAFLDAGQARWPMPGREEGFYRAWRGLAWRERSLPAAAREVLRELPDNPEQALLAALEQLGVSSHEARAYMQAHLSRLPGWAAHVRWRGEKIGDFDLVSYLAMRLSYERALLSGSNAAGDLAAASALDGSAAFQPGSSYERVLHIAEALGCSASTTAAQLEAAAEVLERLPVEERPLIWLAAYEAHYGDRLIKALTRPANPGPPKRPAAQLVCCIDARSEGLRRHLEGLGAYETLGFAGFFAVAIRYRDLAGGAPSALCPVLLEPSNEIHERAREGAENLAARTLVGRGVLAGAEESFHAAKDEMLSPFALAEASGWLAAPVAACRTLLPGLFGALRTRLFRAAVPPAPTVLGVNEGFSFEERALFAEVALTMMGLTSGFARLVVLCAHGSSTENNPYEAALNCGACGGNRGAPNARVAAAILNGQEVREHLAEKGIQIPKDTWFIAAEHDTATDTVTLLDLDDLPAEHDRTLRALERDLDEAGRRLSAERCAALPGAPAAPKPEEASRHVHARSSDWSQVFPEWGLAGNAAFIVAPRSVTKGIDLNRRAFLHSYDAEVDTDGSALETILTAPLLVAQWINCQYYFSTVDPVVFGAGTKTIHNVVGGIGVLAGHNGDLQLGLPWQSLADGARLVHEPMRLLAIVQAPIARIDALIVRNTILQHLFDNEWVALAAREQSGQPWLRYRNHGWEPWLTQEVTNA